MSTYPGKAPGLVVYQHSIIAAKQHFDPAAWMAYDFRYRHKAALVKLLNWETIDTSLYSESFAYICLSEAHLECSCPLSGNVSTPSSAPPIITQTSKVEHSMPLQAHNSKLCGLFNHHMGNAWTYNVCKFTRCATWVDIQRPIVLGHMVCRLYQNYSILIYLQGQAFTSVMKACTAFIKWP